MKKIKRIKEPLYLLTKKRLISIINDKKFKIGESLPPEQVLADMLGISKSTLREAIRILEDEGIIIRKQGSGNFIARTVSQIQSGMEMLSGITEQIRNIGMKASTPYKKVGRDLADKSIANKLNIPVGSPIYILERTRFADEEPAAYTISYFSEKIVGEDFNENCIEESIFDFLLTKKGNVVNFSKANVIPIYPGGKICKRLHISQNMPLLLLEQIFYNQLNEVIYYAKDYFTTGLFNFYIVRKRSRDQFIQDLVNSFSKKEGE